MIRRSKLNKTVSELCRIICGASFKKAVVSHEAKQLMKILEHANIDLVLDVGANVGQFGHLLRGSGYRKKILSFEPLSAAYTELLNRASGDESWLVHPRCALGNQEGESEINVSLNSVSSSLLPMLNTHERAENSSVYVGKEKVQVYRLDEMVNQYNIGESRAFLKLDAQGYEWPIVEGASRLLPHLLGIYCELSLVPLYEGQLLWREMIDQLAQCGFVLWAFQNGFTDQRDGRQLQINGIFLNKSFG